MTMRQYRTENLIQWVTSKGLGGASEAELIQGVCNRLNDSGMSLVRVNVSRRTLHPVLGAHMFIWNVDGDVVKQEDWDHASFGAADLWERNPFYYMMTEKIPRLRVRLSGCEDKLQFPILEDLRNHGATDYLAISLPFGESGKMGNVDFIATSWASNASAGFTDEDIATIEELLPHLAIAIKSYATFQIANSVIATYLGKDAGQRVLSGEIERGALETIRAVLWLCDLQGFTKIADSSSGDELVIMLNEYFECVVNTVHDYGGQVLKFMGDGLLAIFKIDESPDMCARALDAAEDALGRISKLNAKRSASGAPITKLNIALHLGDVMYGNIGARDRLDFTVIGPAVNEASRIEAICGQLDQNLIASLAFSQGAERCARRLVSLGRYALRGVSTAQELFTIPPEDVP